jgi:acyl-CoA thioester hydrolase
MSLLSASDLDVRWGDLDALGHVNNATYATYVEEARLRWFSALDGAWRNPASYPVVVAQSINYRRAIEWPARLRVEIHAARIGTSSLTLGFRILDGGDGEAADGTTVLVWVDAASGRSGRLPDSVRAAAEAALAGAATPP